MSRPKRKPITTMAPIERAILRRNWTRQGIDAAIHALTGNNVAELCGKAGSLFFVALHATQHPHKCRTLPERRVIRGAVNTLGDLVDAAGIAEHQRAAVWAGLEAVKRLAPLVNADALFVSAVALKAIADVRPVVLSDFPD
jgi:hypothetical protein